ncbi:hypothetical protein DE146DRAFT_662648 [Phaeosphaeria sp. MPI-PUGE-AT-0046c]|nr:hypothetical protein DE146DRAFT_662648 [Phaeosphaeria sp. MPI-PUGE-AT-0046c]
MIVSPLTTALTGMWRCTGCCVTPLNKTCVLRPCSSTFPLRTQSRGTPLTGFKITPHTTLRKIQSCSWALQSRCQGATHTKQPKLHGLLRADTGALGNKLRAWI